MVFNAPNGYVAISSKWTIFCKLIVPFLIVAMALCGPGEPWLTFIHGQPHLSEPVRYEVVQLIYFLLIFLYNWICFSRLKAVWVGNRTLFITDFFKQTEVPIDNILDVRDDRLRFLDAHPQLDAAVPVTIIFKKPTAFGHRIRFMPKEAWHWSIQNPVVKELKKLAELDVQDGPAPLRKAN